MYDRKEGRLLSLLDRAHDQRGSRSQPEKDPCAQRTALICAVIRLMNLAFSMPGPAVLSWSRVACHGRAAKNGEHPSGPRATSSRSNVILRKGR